MQTKQHPSVDSSPAEETMPSSTASDGARSEAASVKAGEGKQPEPDKKGQTRHYFSMDESPIEEVMFSTLPSGATEVSIFFAKDKNHEKLGGLKNIFRSFGYDVLVDTHPERDSFLKVTVPDKPERVLNTLMDSGLFPSAPLEEVKGEAEKVGKFQQFREVALKYATRSAVVSQAIMTFNAWITRDSDKAAAGITFFLTNFLAAIRGTGKRGGEVENLFAKGYKELELEKAGIQPVDTLHYKQQQENFSGVRKGVNKVVDFAWNKHPYEIGEVAATTMNAQMTFKMEKGKLKFKNAQNNPWWLLNTFTSFLAGGTLGFVPPKAHVAEGKEDANPSSVRKGWSFLQTHSTKIGGVANILSNVFAVMSGVEAMQNYKIYKEKGEEGLKNKPKKLFPFGEAKGTETVDVRLPANDRREGFLPKVPFLSDAQRYLVAGVTAMTFTSIWLGVGLMTFLGDKNKKRDKGDDTIANDLAAKSAELVLQAEASQQPEIARKLAKYFGERKDVKGSPEALYNLITQKAQALRASPFLEVDFGAQAPAAGTKPEHQQEAAKQSSVAERVGATKREGQWTEQSGTASTPRKENLQPRAGQWAEQPEIDPAMRKEKSSQMSAV